MNLFRTAEKQTTCLYILVCTYIQINDKDVYTHIITYYSMRMHNMKLD